MYNRLVAFGCSFTYGHGLPDCVGPNNAPLNNRSEYAWPTLVANKLGVDCSNQSLCGSSNQRIAHSVKQFSFAPGDLCIVLWSYVDRSMVLGDDKFPIDIFPRASKNSDPNLFENYFRAHSDADMLYQTYMSMSHTELYLKNKNIPYIGLHHLENFNFAYSPFSCDIKSTFIPPTWKVDWCPDGLHYGVESHKLLAESILNLINE